MVAIRRFTNKNVLTGGNIELIQNDGESARTLENGRRLGSYRNALRWARPGDARRNPNGE